ncbi:MAG: hypothetical protein IIA85_02480 [Nanoarchaeota archaeon]|nr:hypothetical protein [Nanoarchaeota archaeon]
MGKFKNKQQKSSSPTKRQLEGMLDILKSIENNGIKSPRELVKMIRGAGFQTLKNKNHLKIFDIYGNPVKGRTNRNLIMPKTNLKGEIYRDIMTDLSKYIRENYNNEIVEFCSGKR